MPPPSFPFHSPAIPSPFPFYSPNKLFFPNSSLPKSNPTSSFNSSTPTPPSPSTSSPSPTASVSSVHLYPTSSFPTTTNLISSPATLSSKAFSHSFASNDHHHVPFLIYTHILNSPYLDDSALIFNQASVLLRRVPGDRRRRPLDTTPIDLTPQEETDSDGDSSVTAENSVSSSEEIDLHDFGIGEYSSFGNLVEFEEEERALLCLFFSASSDDHHHVPFLIYTHILNSNLLPNNYTFPFILKSLSDSVDSSKTVLIMGYRDCGKYDDALIAFKTMQYAGLVPNRVTMVNALAACGGSGAIEMGVWIHEFITRNDWELDVVLGTALVDMYLKCGRVQGGQFRGDQMELGNSPEVVALKVEDNVQMI
ncbi:Pentatricopeptide repeat-containing protein At3g62890, partial [Linum perenne]